MSEEMKDDDENTQDEVDEEEELEEEEDETSDEEVEDTLRSIAEKMANVLDCEVSDLQNKVKEEELLKMLSVIQEYSKEERNQIMIGLYKLELLTEKQVNDANELNYTPEK
jgi:hypothetical protein